MCHAARGPRGVSRSHDAVGSGQVWPYATRAWLPACTSNWTLNLADYNCTGRRAAHSGARISLRQRTVLTVSEWADVRNRRTSGRIARFSTFWEPRRPAGASKAAQSQPIQTMSKIRITPVASSMRNDSRP